MVGNKKRHSIRLPDYDYSQGGAYFVTICVHGRENKLGDVIEGEIKVSAFGAIASDAFSQLEAKFPTVRVPSYCVMPNHVHSIVVIDDTGRGGVTPPNYAEGEETSPYASLGRSDRSL